MEETLIKLETARLARIKGFNEKVSSWYFGDNEKAHDNPMPYRNDELGSHNSSAPTQSLLQKWIREKYDIHCQPLIAEENGKNTYEACIAYNSQKYKDTPLDDSDNWFDTYEEALEDCLIEALKMLPDWKP